MRLLYQDSSNTYKSFYKGYTSKNSHCNLYVQMLQLRSRCRFQRLCLLRLYLLLARGFTVRVLEARHTHTQKSEHDLRWRMYPQNMKGYSPRKNSSTIKKEKLEKNCRHPGAWYKETQRDYKISAVIRSVFEWVECHAYLHIMPKLLKGTRTINCNCAVCMLIQPEASPNWRLVPQL